MSKYPEIYPSLRPKSKKELANEYCVCRDTIRAYCQEIGIVTNRRLTIPQLRKFYDHYGIPVQEYRGQGY